MAPPKKKDTQMSIPKLSKPAIYSATVGAALLAINGFSWGGWVTGSTAREIAADAVVAALVPICIDQSKRDPQFAEKIHRLKNNQSYQRSDTLMKAGWATMPGANEPNRQVASACGKKLVAMF
jgi:hypothetical protein